MLQFGEITRDPAKLPAASVAALMARGFSHVLGNEVASQVVSLIRATIVESTNKDLPAEKHIKAKDVTKDQVQSFRAANPETITKWTNESIADTLAELDAGTIGQRVSTGPRVDPVSRQMGVLARAEVVTTLQSHKIKVPKGDEVVKFPNGDTRTMAQMIAKRLEVHGDRIRKEAEKAVADAARKRAKAEAEAKSKPATSADELGL